MNIKTSQIYLFYDCRCIDKYAPIYNKYLSHPSVEYVYDLGYGRGQRLNISKIDLVFECNKVRSVHDEKKLRTYDLLRAEPGNFIFVNELILNCLTHLVGKDIQVIPAKIYTKNGVVTGYHLIDIISIVHGVDKEYSTYNKFTGYLNKLIPKDKDFMQGHELAREDECADIIYITLVLRASILHAKQGKLKGLGLWTPKKYWETSHNIEKCPY